MPSSQLSQFWQGSQSSSQDPVQRNTLYPPVLPSEQPSKLVVSKTAQTLLDLYPQKGKTVSCWLSVKVSTDKQWDSQDQQTAEGKWAAYTSQYPGQFGGVVDCH